VPAGTATDVENRKVTGILDDFYRILPQKCRRLKVLSLRLHGDRHDSSGGSQTAVCHLV
jgi:hypothetical protein